MDEGRIQRAEKAVEAAKRELAKARAWLAVCKAEERAAASYAAIPKFDINNPWASEPARAKAMKDGKALDRAKAKLRRLQSNR